MERGKGMGVTKEKKKVILVKELKFQKVILKCQLLVNKTLTFMSIMIILVQLPVDVAVAGKFYHAIGGIVVTAMKIIGLCIIYQNSELKDLLLV